MSSQVKKSAILEFNEEDKTKELPPPSKIKKMLAKGEIKREVGETVLKLQNAHKDLKTEINQAKEELNSGRQNNESTVVFNLRQLEANDKVEELEKKKVEIEKEINSMMNLKNSKVHEDLQKVVRFLVSEMKRIAPMLDATIKDGAKNVEVANRSIKELNDIKEIISKVYEEQKQTVEHNFEEKIKLKEEIAELELKHHLIEEKFKFDHENYQKLTTDINQIRNELSTLLNQKLEIEQELSKIVGSGRDEVFRLQNEKNTLDEIVGKIKVELHEFEIKKKDKDQEELEYEKKIKPLKDQIHSLYDQVAEKNTKVNQLNTEILKLEKEIAFKEEGFATLKSSEREVERQLHSFRRELELKKDELLSTETKYNHLLNLISKTEDDYIQKSKEFDQKLINVESDIKLKVREKEIELKEKLDALQNELDEKQKNYAKLIYEHEDQYRQKTLWFEKELVAQKSRYSEVLVTAEKSFQEKIESYEREFEQKKFNAEFELRQKEEKVNQELKERIKSTEQGIGLFLDQNKTDLVNDLADVVFVKGQYNLIPRDKVPNFEELKDEMKKVIGAHLHKSALTRNTYLVHRTILYFWAITMSLATLGLLAFQFFKK